MAHYDFLIVGGGIFGLSTAISLKKRKYNIGLINPDTIPHHLAASTDVSKAVRMEYGSDIEYFEMAEICIDRWKTWNDLFNKKLYHEVGFLMLSKDKIKSSSSTYERSSYENLIAHGYQPDLLNAAEIKKRFPGVNNEVYTEACYNPKGGFVESGKAIEILADYARSIGVSIYEGHTAKELVIENNRLQSINTNEGRKFQFGHAIIAAGPYTPYLVPDLQPYMKATGHPVYWLTPDDPAEFTSPNLPVFMADISNSGWYGFPFHRNHGIVKVAKHAHGLIMNPSSDDRIVTSNEVGLMRDFLRETFPKLEKAPLVYTRRCLYSDTLDGHFWIDKHPHIKGLSISTGGSGHGMKMGPIIGEMTADMAEGKSHRFSKRYKWRHLTPDAIQAEESRNMTVGKL